MKKVVALDVGGTAVKYAVVDQKGGVSREGSFPTNAQGGGQALMQRMLSCVDELREGLDEVLGVGVSTAGQIASDHATVRFASENLPGWTGMPIAQNVRMRTGLPCYVENDVNAAALGEWWLGAAKGCQALVMVTLGTGLGGAAIMNGRLMTGAMGGAGEFGHIVLHPGGRRCTCGMNGCLEQYASTGVLTRDSMALPQGHPGRGDVRALFARCKAGDAQAEEIIDHWIGELCLGLASLIHCFGPDVVLLGGGVSGQGAYLSDRVRAGLNGLVIPSFLDGLRVETAQLSNRAGLLGAANNLFMHSAEMSF